MEQSQICDVFAEFVQKKSKYTNCYFTTEELRKKCSEERISGEIRNGSLLIWIQKEGHARLHFIGDDFNWTEGLRFPGEETTEIRIVTKDGLGEYDLSGKLNVKEMIQYMRYRQGGFKEADLASGIETEFCTPEDIPVIRRMLNKTFTFTDDPPSEEELAAFIQNKAVICLRDGEELMGAVTFEEKGKISHVRNIFVRDRYRQCGVGRKLLLSYFCLHKDFKGFIVWCKMANLPARKLYESVGYTGDNLYDYIFLC